MAGGKKRKYGSSEKSPPQDDNVMISIEALKAQVLDVQNKKLEAFNLEVADVHNKITDVHNKITDVHNKITDVHNKITDVDNKITDLHNKITDLHNKNSHLNTDLKKLRPVLKHFVWDRGLTLINEFIAFISQIHGSGVQWKYKKGYNTGKFNKLVGGTNFEANCQKFCNDQDDSSLRSTADIDDMFNNLCNARNSLVHYEGPEDCLLKILKFEKKHGDLLHVCTEEVQYCVPRIGSIARHFVGVYRLKRLTCQFIGRFLASHGLSWRNMTEFEKILEGNRKLINEFKPPGIGFKFYKSWILDMFKSSTANGPKWTGISKDDNGDFGGVRAAFKKCVDLDMFPPRASHTLEFHVLEHGGELCMCGF